MIGSVLWRRYGGSIIERNTLLAVMCLPQRLKARAASPSLLLILTVALLGYPSIASAQSEFGITLGAGPMQSFGERSELQGNLFVFPHIIRIPGSPQALGKYAGIGLEVSYTFDDQFVFWSYMARIDFGLGERRLKGDHRNLARFTSPFLAIMGGYGNGTIWDETFVEKYGQIDEVEVSVSGIPLFMSLGWRRIGGWSFSLEVIGGMTIILSEEAELPEGSAPAIIPGIGVRIGLGYDSFQKVIYRM